METGDLCDEDNLTKRHKQEKRDLQSKIQALKKSVPKGDKKKKKEITEEIAKLESALEERHKQELDRLRPADDISDDERQPEVPHEDTEAPPEDAEPAEAMEEGEPQRNVRVSRAQKRRNKRETEAKEREKRIAEQMEKSKDGPRVQEINSIKQVLKSMNLKLHNIPADGNCLYLAVNHQLQISGRPTLSVNELRKKTAEFMRKYKEEFMPFMCNELDETEVVSEEQYETYCKDVANTKLWGGQLELRALSNILKCPIKVIQATGPPTLQGESFTGTELVLAYHRHLYRLGEHYNSTLPASEEEDI